MFDQFKALSAVTDLLKNQDKIREAGDRVKARLEALEVIGEAGGGVVRVVAKGSLRVARTEVSDAVAAGLASADAAQKALAEAMLTEAMNDALAKGQAAAQSIVQEEAEAMGLGGLTGQLSSLLPDAVRGS